VVVERGISFSKSPLKKDKVPEFARKLKLFHKIYSTKERKGREKKGDEKS